ncbi:MAG TPA: glycogen debranching N-terminal domain-containing protein [Dehalococcoidia bacterium]|nr:glycogen debranching N-terminal domain-containing protein [Dehalococcoidia bacterium]
MTEPARARSWEYLPDVFGGVESISDAHIVREGGVFLLTDYAGRVPAGNKRGLGLYHRDTRHLSTYHFTLSGADPVVLLSTSDSGHSLEQVLGNHKAVTGEGWVIGRCTVEAARSLTVGSGLEERLRITNYNPFPVVAEPGYAFGADFADIFEVRGHVRSHAGHHLRPEVDRQSVIFRYTGADGVLRSTRLLFDTPPDHLTDSHASYRIELGPHQSVELRLQAFVEAEGAPSAPGVRFHRAAQDYARWQETFTSIETDNEVFNRVLGRSFTDLRMLVSEDPSGGRYFAAGTPWFDALFGRDSLITASQLLPYRADLARECLFLLARYQGSRIDPFSAEEPGKILHELRKDELSAIGELPYGRYYGSVDSTPLFLLLAGEYYEWTADLAAMRALRPNLASALRWVREFGVADGAYLTYQTDSPTGLRNQGWKDSENCVVHDDGSLCEGPIALAEVQGYLYAALRRLARIFAALDEPEQAEECRREASALMRRFREDFWLADRRLVPMALDGAGRPAALASNAGQVLWSRILTDEQAEAVRDQMFSNEMFSGWGIRTLASNNPAYNPVGYHLGTIWPHDNAIIAAGLKRHGFDEETNEIATAMFDAAVSLPSFRLPEVYGGHPRSMHQPPVPYPVACRPQAWAAGAVLMVLAAMLGLAPDAPNGKLYLVRPRLPHWLGRVSLRGLRVGRGAVDLTFLHSHGRTRAHVDHADGVEVVQSDSWPD